MKEKIKQVLDVILEKFRTGEVPQAVAMSMFPIPDLPSSKWSLLNRTLMFFAGTQDARGFRQWVQAGRKVKKGSKALRILVPCFKTVENEETGEEKQILRGFVAGPVFRVEDTEGEPLDYENAELPELPFKQRAEEWGLTVKAIPGNHTHYGHYSGMRKEICLASKEESVFFHELAHAAHEKVNGKLKSGQDPFQEIVAELSAQALCRMAGKDSRDTLGNSYKYIEAYAEKLKVSPYTACVKVLSDTEKVLSLILKGEEPMKVEVAVNA